MNTKSMNLIILWATGGLLNNIFIVCKHCKNIESPRKVIKNTLELEILESTEYKKIYNSPPWSKKQPEMKKEIVFYLI